MAATRVNPPGAATAAATAAAECPSPCGFLVLDKPAGPTSHACVARVRRSYGLRRVGHGGTLDPAVTGVLPIAIGPATRLLPYLEGAKAYEAVVQLGQGSDSDDLEGEVHAGGPVPPLRREEIEVLLDRFRGPILQVPPQVSAVHVAGERAYTRARRGESSELAPRPVTIEQLTLLGWDAAGGRLELAVRCSAGTYIRALARDLGAAIGCGGLLARLRRTEALGFSLEQAVPLERLDANPPPPLIAPLEALGHLPHQHLTPEQLALWRCGRSLESAELHQPHQPLAVIGPDGILAGIARSDGAGLLRPKLVFDAAG
jgi:tRNA pseudouridine55 synthase